MVCEGKSDDTGDKGGSKGGRKGDKEAMSGSKGDKGSSSAHASASLMLNASRLLKPGGVFLLVSCLLPPKLLFRLLHATQTLHGLGFDPRHFKANIVRAAAAAEHRS